MERKDSILRKMHNTMHPLLKVELKKGIVYGTIIQVIGYEGTTAIFREVTDYNKWERTAGAEGIAEYVLEEEDVISWEIPSNKL